MIEQKITELMTLMGVPKDKPLVPINDKTLPSDANEWFTLLSQYSFDWTHEFLPGWGYSSYEESLYNFQVMEKMDFGPFDPLEKSFLLLSDGSDGGCGIGIKGQPYENEIVIREIHAPWAIGFQNISDLLDTCITCRNENVWKNPEDPNFNLYYEIAARINPKYDAWK